MLSWQAKIFLRFLNIIAYCKLIPKKINIVKLRNKLELLTNLIKNEKGANLKEVKVYSLTAKWIIPNNCSELIIFYLHGGAYSLGSTHTYRPLLMRLAKITKAKIFAIDYRLAPENVFPAALDDAISAYKWLLDQNYSEKNIIIAGDSAGGGLSIATLVTLRDRNVPLPHAAILLSPWLDLAMKGKSITNNSKRDYLINPELAQQAAKLYLHTTNAMHPLASPLYADLRALPPIYIQVGSAEILLSDSTRFAKKAKAAGVNVTLSIWQNMIHGWHFFYDIMPESQKALNGINDFIEKLRF